MKLERHQQQRKSPAIRIDNSLEKYRGKVISREKLDKANEMLKTIGLPKPKKQG